MDPIKKLFQSFFFLNCWTAAGVVLLSAESFLYLQQPVHLNYLFFAFCSALFLYNFQRLFITEYNGEKDDYRKWLLKNRWKLGVAIILSFTGMLISVFYFTFLQWMYILPAAVLSMLYSVGDNKTIKGFRELPYLKIFIVVFCWGYVTGFLPGVFSGLPFSEFYPVFILKTLFAFCVYIPFEIRDMNEDPAHMKTLPQVTGIKGAVTAGMLTLFLFAWLSMKFLAVPWSVLVPVCLLTAMALLFSTRKNNSMFYFLFIDSLLVMKPLFSMAVLKFF